MVHSEIKNLGRVWLTAIACLCYCHSITGKLPKGKCRLISLVPIFYIFATLPLYTNTVFFTLVTAAYITWFATFKLLLFAFDMGPLGPDPAPKSLLAFVVTAAMAFKIKPKSAPKKSQILPLYLGTEIVATAVFFYDYKLHLHPTVRLVVHISALFLLIQILIRLSSLVARLVLGLELEEPSDEPYLSNSFRDLWGRRWNLTVTYYLKQTVYEPVRAALGEVVSGETAALTGVMATFVVSGLAHELFFWYVIRGVPSWEMTSFFVLHGVFVVMEFKLAEWKLRLPPSVAVPVTVGFGLWTGSVLFFPTLMRNTVDARLTQEIRCAIEWVKGCFGNSSHIDYA